MARSARPSRSRLSYAKIGLPRIMLSAAAALIGGWLTFALAISGATRTENPEMALRFIPGESVALASQADHLLLEKPGAPPGQTRTMALAALRQQPLNPRALRVLGYFASAKGNDEHGRAYLKLAEHQSRRDVLTQLWLIEDSVRRNDVKDALRHYDIALRTKLAAYDTLFPILVSAIDDQAIRNELSPYIRADQAWARAFLSYANLNSKNLPALVDLIVESGGLAGDQFAHEQDVGLLQRLTNERLFSEARRLYLHMRGATTIRLVSPRFDATDRTTQFGSMGWQVSAAPESGGSLSEGVDHREILSVFANAATTAAVASKLLYLRPGRYAFEARLSAMNAGDGGFLRWQLRCARAGGDQVVWTVDSAGVAPKSMITVPDDCAVQFLDIVASGGSGQNGMEAIIIDVSLRR